MSKTATQTVYETGSETSYRFSVSSLFSARSESTLTPKKPEYNTKYFQPSETTLAAAGETDIIEVPVHEAHLPRRKSYNVIGRVNDRMMGGLGPNEEFKLLRMQKGEYLRFWARDESGEYMGTEPEGMGHIRLKAQGW